MTYHPVFASDHKFEPLKNIHCNLLDCGCTKSANKEARHSCPRPTVDEGFLFEEVFLMVPDSGGGCSLSLPQILRTPSKLTSF